MDHPLLLPLLAQVFLTFAVWSLMYATRLPFLVRERIDPEALKDRRNAERLLESVSAPSDNFKNQCELPVLFYALALVLMATAREDGVQVALAWAFVSCRYLHAAIHVTVNRVAWRFVAYAAGAAALWAGWARLGMQVLG